VYDSITVREIYYFILTEKRQRKLLFYFNRKASEKIVEKGFLPSEKKILRYQIYSAVSVSECMF
jgi:hypothetical protein